MHELFVLRRLQSANRTWKFSKNHQTLTLKSDEEKTEAFPLTFIPRRIEEEDGEDEVVTNLLPKITCTISSWTIDEKEKKKKGK